MRKHLKDLNPEQRRAVTTTEGPVLVLAGAGTGKTRVITVRIAHLLASGVDPKHVLAVTFTNKAADEMRERVAGLVGKTRAEGVTIGTFHAFCARTLRARGEAIGIPKNFSICDAADQLAAAKAALRDLHVPEAKLRPRDLVARVSLLKNRLVTPDATLDAAVDDEDALVGHGYRRYVENLGRARVLDFDDLLLKMLELLERDEPTLKALRRRYRYLMVDEYQDTNGPQYEIVRTLAGARRNLCVVGDDDQSIYGWRGADVRKILDFERDFPDATVVRLETNYRSTKQILDAANRVIGHNPARHEKSLRSALGNGEDVMQIEVDDEEREARGVVGDICKRVGRGDVRYRDCAILFRTQTQPRAFEAVLRARDVPYVLVGGMSFFDRKEVRDVLAYLKLVLNPDDEVSLLRVINCPPRGIGKTTVQKVLDFATAHAVTAPRALERLDEIGLPPAAADAVGAFRAALAPFRGTEPGRRLVKTVRDLIEAVDYESELIRCYPEAQARDQRRAGLDEILNFAENFVRRSKKPTLAGFLEQLALSADGERTTDDRHRDAVTLMTLHAAKGLEYPRVYLVGLEEGILPHAKSVAGEGVEEERRLMYVGITRARQNLTITHAKQRAQYGRRADRMPSRFLFEMNGTAPPKGWRAAGAPEKRRPRARS